MTQTERTIEALTVALADALAGRPQRPEDYKLISAVRAANEELRRLAAVSVR
jgi:hypothetical protein